MEECARDETDQSAQCQAEEKSPPEVIYLKRGKRFTEDNSGQDKRANKRELKLIDLRSAQIFRDA